MSLLGSGLYGEPMPRTPTSRPRRFRCAALATLTGLLAVAGIACGGDDDDGEDTGTDPTAETTTTPPTTAPLTPEEDAKATYLDFVGVVHRLGSPSRPTRMTPSCPSSACCRSSAWNRPRQRGHPARPRTSCGSRATGTPTPRRPLLSGPTDSPPWGTVWLRTTCLSISTMVRLYVRSRFATRTLEVTLASQGGSWVVAAIDEVAVVDGEVPCEH